MSKEALREQRLRLERINGCIACLECRRYVATRFALLIRLTDFGLVHQSKA